MNLPDRIRPKRWADVIGQVDAIGKLTLIRTTCGCLRGRAYWLDGPSGVGKSTIAELIAAEVTEPWAVTRLDALALTPARLREIDRDSSQRPLGRGYCYVVNEAQGLTREAIEQLLTMLDHPRQWITWIFTTMPKGQQRIADMEDGSALVDRCTRLPLRAEPVVAAIPLQRIAQGLHLDGRPLADYVRLVERCHGSIRAALQAIECGEMMVKGPT